MMEKRVDSLQWPTWKEDRDSEEKKAGKKEVQTAIFSSRAFWMS